MRCSSGVTVTVYKLIALLVVPLSLSLQMQTVAEVSLYFKSLCVRSCMHAHVHDCTCIRALTCTCGHVAERIMHVCIRLCVNIEPFAQHYACVRAVSARTQHDMRRCACSMHMSCTQPFLLGIRCSGIPFSCGFSLPLGEEGGLKLRPKSVVNMCRWGAVRGKME